MNQNNRRVVVTGMGAVSPVGNDVQTSWENLISGVHGIGPVSYTHLFREFSVKAAVIF